MELGISIFGALVLVFLLLTFLSAVFAISIVLALTVGIFFTFSFLIQNIEDVKILDAFFLFSVSIFGTASIVTLFGRFTVIPPRFYKTKKPKLSLRLTNFTLLVLLLLTFIIWYGFEKIVSMGESFSTIPI
ncbi:MAG: hypothetical protein CMM11_00905 [Rhodospirillaceae bacterium]|nr:hypothetical protein [Rhodospirillaceae bacterium]|tara:strand:- start:1367 stop:1759 length:393 start_codon:yes stop_codon:yes gene_type:complete